MLEILKMISKEDNLKSLTCDLLDCGSLDLDFLIDLVTTIDNEKFKIKDEETFLFPIDREGIISEAVENIEGYEGKLNINALIYEVLSLVVRRVNEIYNIELEGGRDVEIYTNCIDSHLSLIDEDFIETHNEETEISKEEQDEIKAIIETFN